MLKAFGAAVVALVLAACGPAARDKVVIVEGDAFLGPADARVTLIEYGSPTCPACKMWHDTFFEEVKRDYVDTGKMRFVFREFAIHGPVDAGIFSIARCAGPEDYFAVLDDAFANQRAIVEAAQKGATSEALYDLGARFRLSRDQVKACLSDSKNVRRINDVGADAQTKGINATPTFVLNGTVLASSDWVAIKPLVDAALAGASVPAQAPASAPTEALHEHQPGDQH